MMHVIAMQHAGKTGYLCSSILQRKESFVFMMSYNAVSSFVLLSAFHFKNNVFMCMCVFRPHELQCPQKPECVRFPGTTGCESCESNPGPLEKQQGLKSTELSLQHLFLYFCTHIRVCDREKGRFSSLSLSIYSFEIASPMKPKVYFSLGYTRGKHA